MKQRLQGILIGILICVFLSGGTVFAKQIEETIKVTYNNIKIIINGKECVPTDVSANVIEPFVYNGTPYVPIRAISQAFDKNVRWDANNSSVIISDKTIVKSKLPTIEVKDSYTSKTGGVSIETAKGLIVKFLTENGIKGPISTELKISEITVPDAWENSKMQLYYVTLDYAWLYGVAVIKDGKVVGILNGMKSLYLADLNNDGKYEVCTNYSYGSGFIDLRINVLDVQNVKKYELSKRFEYDLLLKIDESTKDLVVYKLLRGKDDTLLGTLKLKDDQLIVEK